MTTTAFTHTATDTRMRRTNRIFSQNIYQVEVNGEDGCFLEFEIMADTASEATAEAEQLASDMIQDILFIQVTLVA